MRWECSGFENLSFDEIEFMWHCVATLRGHESSIGPSIDLLQFEYGAYDVLTFLTILLFVYGAWSLMIILLFLCVHPRSAI